MSAILAGDHPLRFGGGFTLKFLNVPKVIPFDTLTQFGCKSALQIAVRTLDREQMTTFCKFVKNGNCFTNGCLTLITVESFESQSEITSFHYASASRVTKSTDEQITAKHFGRILVACKVRPSG